jgi:hypothetical protein
VTIAGDPGFSVASATNSNAIRAKPTTAKKVKAGIAALPCTQLNTRSNVRFRKTQALKKRPRRRGPYDATHFGHSLGKLPTGLRDKVPFQECKRQRPPTVGVSRVPVPISALRADTAKALGLTVPPSLIARADEVIE